MPKFDSTVTVDLSGPDGNAFALLGLVAKAITAAGGTSDDVGRFRNEATSSDYRHLVATCGEWVNFTDLSEEDDDE